MGANNTRAGMKQPPSRTPARRAWAAGALALALLAGTASAGVPQPGIVQYGQVIGESGELLTSGVLTWTYAPAGGGDPVVVSTALEPIDGPGGPYSYKTVVPLEAIVPGAPSSGAIPVALTPVEYVRSGAIDGTSVTMTHNVFVSADDISSVRRVDVCADCPAVTMTKHSADLNEDYRFSLAELLRFVELHSASPTHEYHVDKTTMDGYKVGAGPRAGAGAAAGAAGAHRHPGHRGRVPHLRAAARLPRGAGAHRGAPAGEGGVARGRGRKREHGSRRMRDR